MAPALENVIRSFHLIAVVLWVGGLIAIAMMVTIGNSKPITAAAKQALFRLVHPAMGAAWIAALTLLLSGWTTLYAKAGWMHGKITLGLILTAVTVVFGSRLKRAAASSEGTGESWTAPKVGTFAVAAGIIALLIVVLAKFRFGQG